MGSVPEKLGNVGIKGDGRSHKSIMMLHFFAVNMVRSELRVGGVAISSAELAEWALLVEVGQVVGAGDLGVSERVQPLWIQVRGAADKSAA